MRSQAEGCMHIVRVLTCITARHDEDAPGLRWQVLLSERRRRDEEALPEGVQVGRHRGYSGLDMGCLLVQCR